MCFYLYLEIFAAWQNMLSLSKNSALCFSLSVHYQSHGYQDILLWLNILRTTFISHVSKSTGISTKQAFACSLLRSRVDGEQTTNQKLPQFPADMPVRGLGKETLSRVSVFLKKMMRKMHLSKWIFSKLCSDADVLRDVGIQSHTENA